MGSGWGPRRWVAALSTAVIVGVTWILFATGNQGVNAATVLAVPLAAFALVLALVDKLPGGSPSRETLAREAARLAGEVAQTAAAERNRLFGDGNAAPADVSFSRYPDAALADPHLVRWREDGGPLEGTLMSIAGFHRSLNRGRLAVLGAPGSGKSVMVNLLTMSLAESAASPEGSRGPVPVLVPVQLSLPAFDPGKDAGFAEPPELARRLETWIAEYLEQVFGVQFRLAVALVRNGWILPVLDGLDEMDREHADPVHARAVMRALNHPGPDGLRPVVIACREPRYRSLATEHPGPGRASVLQDATAIWVHPLKPSQVCAYLAGVFPRHPGPAPDCTAHVEERWQPVIDLLHGQPECALAEALGSPLTLYLAIAGYYDEHSEPARLLRLDADGIQRDLLGRLIPALTLRHSRPGGGLYDPRDVAHWLTSLSVHLRERQADGASGTDLYLHELWRAAGKRAPRYQGAAAVALMVAAPLLTLGAVYAHVSGYPIAPTWEGRLEIIWGVAFVIGGFFAVAEAPSQPRRLDLKLLWTRRAAREFVKVSAIGSVSGLVSGIPNASSSGFIVGPLVGFTLGLMFGLVTTAGREQTSIKQPHQFLRQNLIYCFAVTLGFSLSSGLACWLIYLCTDGRVGWLVGSSSTGPTTAVVGGLALGLTGGITMSLFDSPWPRYSAAVIVLKRRGRLPSRPARFLDWACEVGLLKISGIALQFRHQDLQDRLLTPNTAAPEPLPPHGE